MHHTPALDGSGGQDAGPSPGPPGAPRPGGRRLRVLLLLACAAQVPAALAAQAPSAGDTAAAAPDRPRAESAVLPEPFPELAARGGAGPWAVGALVGGVALIAAAGLFRRARRERGDAPGEPLLVFTPPETPPPALPPRPRAAASVPARQLRLDPFVPPLPAPATAAAEDELTVKIELPAGRRIEFLPGALEVLEGPDPQREIRFVGGVAATPEFTIGRTHGPADRHVQLSAPTVSRVHARMRFAGGEWSIRNLSTTNPLRVNGDELTREEEGRVLADGDRIEVGEVVLRFRETVG